MQRGHSTEDAAMPQSSTCRELEATSQIHKEIPCICQKCLVNKKENGEIKVHELQFKAEIKFTGKKVGAAQRYLIHDWTMEFFHV